MCVALQAPKPADEARGGLQEAREGPADRERRAPEPKHAAEAVPAEGGAVAQGGRFRSATDVLRAVHNRPERGDKRGRRGGPGVEAKTRGV